VWDMSDIFIRENVLVVGGAINATTIESATVKPKPIKAVGRDMRRKSSDTSSIIMPDSMPVEDSGNDNAADDAAAQEEYLQQMAEQDDTQIELPVADDVSEKPAKSSRVGRYTGKLRKKDELNKRGKFSDEAHPSDLTYQEKKNQKCSHPPHAKTTESGYTICRQCGTNYEDIEETI
jgi:hypothetical protein